MAIMGKIIALYPNFLRLNDHPTAEVQVGHLDPRKGFNSIVPNRVDAIVTDARWSGGFLVWTSPEQLGQFPPDPNGGLVMLSGRNDSHKKTTKNTCNPKMEPTAIHFSPVFPPNWLQRNVQGDQSRLHWHWAFDPHHWHQADARSPGSCFFFSKQMAFEGGIKPKLW